MHLSEGVLHPPVLAVGYIIAVVGIAIGLRKIENQKLPLVALFAATFFVASTIHIPVGIGSVHLILNGLAGLFLGWAVFPAFLIGLVLQLLFFSFGGFTVLGVNLCIMALPAVAIRYLLKRFFTREATARQVKIIGALAGILGVAGAAVIASLTLALDGGKDYVHLIGLLIVSHIPVFIVDSLISVGIVTLVVKMRPSIYDEIS